MRDILARARRQMSGRLGDVTLNLPFISIAVSPKDRERKVAREIVIRLRDRRILSASECCDGCVERAFASLQEIRKSLVDKQVELVDMQDGPLYLVIDIVLSGIRQFLTFQERLERASGGESSDRPFERNLPVDRRQSYFDSLEVLRGHLSRGLAQVAAIAGMEAPVEGLNAHYHGPWQEEAYTPPDK
ncbi:MAG TPA: hypothetical protein VG897_11125 [Terriglobales bacterium]|nr:hypothetical protein [Terriglobales bacterium]